MPWHAAIYKRTNEHSRRHQICGGTIITAKIVISAMHCFWDPSEDAAYPKSHYRVAVGKSRRAEDAREEHVPQFFYIHEIIGYNGYSDYKNNYANDIALIVLDNYIQFHAYVVPICLPPDHPNDDEMDVPPGTLGLTAGTVWPRA